MKKFDIVVGTAVVCFGLSFGIHRLVVGGLQAHIKMLDTQIKTMKEAASYERQPIVTQRPAIVMQSVAVNEPEVEMPAQEEIVTSHPPVSSTPEIAQRIATDEATREERRQEFMERMRQRSEEERLAMVEKLNLDEMQTAQLDSIIIDLNHQVSQVSEAWADYIRSVGRMDSDFGIRIMHDISGALVAAYDAMDSAMPAGWRDTLGQDERRGGMFGLGGGALWIDPANFASLGAAMMAVGDGAGRFLMGAPMMRGGGARPPRE